MSAAQPMPDSRPEPTKFYRWLVLMMVSLVMFGNYYFYDALEPLAKLLQEQLHFTDQNIGLLNSFYSIAPIATVLIGGILIDRIGTRKALLIFSVICLIGSVITAIGVTFPLMAAGRFVFGMGAESLVVAVTTARGQMVQGQRAELRPRHQSDDRARGNLDGAEFAYLGQGRLQLVANPLGDRRRLR